MRVVTVVTVVLFITIQSSLSQEEEQWTQQIMTKIEDLLEQKNQDIMRKLEHLDNKLANLENKSHFCSCKPGFIIGSDKMTCQDIDECSINNGGCNQNCTNTVASHFCSCKPGFILGSDNMTCLVDKAVGCEAVDGVIVADTCLYFSRSGEDWVTWSGAVAACETKGGQLVSPDDPGAIMDYLNADVGHTLITGNYYFWVGASDSATEGSWVMVDGRPLGDQVPWLMGSPNGYGSGDADCLRLDDTGYTDLICTHTCAYICNLDRLLKTRN